MRTVTTFIFAFLMAASVAQEAAARHRTQPVALSNQQLHEWAITRTVQVVVEPNKPVSSFGSGVWVSKDGYVATCWHVVRNASEVQVKVGYPSIYDLEKNTFVSAAFAVYAATVVASDDKADVAILKVSPNPFVTPPGVQSIVSGEPGTKLTSADLRTSLPSPGDLALLAGYPLARPDLLTQAGTVAAVALVDDFQGTEASKGLRIELSLVSNPANSGGPVFDSDGKVLGLLEGNFLSPVKDEAQRQALYVRPKRDANGNFVLDANGQPQPETALMYQNSGISLVVPARFVQDALDQAKGKPPAAPKAGGSVVVQGMQVINAPPDAEPKVRVPSSLAAAALKQQTANFLATFRSFLAQQEEREHQLLESARPDPRNTTREDREAAYARLGDQFLALREEMRQEYHARFKGEAKRCRDDFWARLPISARDPRSVRLYDYGLDLIELQRVADDLERLSRMLPE